MPFRAKRRIFAAPFVVTIAAAACNAGDPQPPKNPETDPTATIAPTTTAAPTSAPTAAPTTAPTAPPVATAAPSVAPVATEVAPVDPPFAERWRVTKDGKKCEAMLQVDCPPAASCNPPPPQVYVCPAAITRFPATVERKKGLNECTTRVVSDNSGCPPNMHCNPPPPHNVSVPCPQ